MTTAGSRILLVDDDNRIRRVISDRLRAKGHEVDEATTGVEALAKIEAGDPDLMILDLMLPELDGLQVLERLDHSGPDTIVITAHGSIDSAVRAVQLGARDFIQKPFDKEHLEHVVARTLESGQLRRRLQSLEHEVSDRHTLVRGDNEAMQKMLAVAEQAAPSESTLLLLGESGVGKEVVARFVHKHSERRAGPFSALNCATLTEALLASELFGHERGAFTGADRAKPGRLEQASGGTMFLDEVAEMSPGLQVKLLRVLQEREFERVGGTRTIRCDVRFIAATHRDLKSAVQNGTFRQDLYYRLNVISLKVPPLRERKEDLPLLIQHFLGRHGRSQGRGELRLSDRARELMLGYDWPGNVRELANVLERAAVLTRGNTIDVEVLPDEIVSLLPSPVAPSDDGPTAKVLKYHDALTLTKCEVIRAALRQTDHHQTKAAELLGLSQPYLARLMKSLGISLKKG